MSIILHIIFAVISLAVTGLAVGKPTSRRLVVTYISIILTVGSGVLLAVVDHALIARVCTTGLTYLAIEIAAVGVSVYRLRRTEKVIAEGSSE